MARWWEHEWVETDMQKTYGPPCLIMDQERVCSKCGFKQSYITNYSWMRVTGKEWYPKTRRKCPEGYKNEICK